MIERALLAHVRAIGGKQKRVLRFTLDSHDTTPFDPDLAPRDTCFVISSHVHTRAILDDPDAIKAIKSRDAIIARTLLDATNIYRDSYAACDCLTAIFAARHVTD